MTPAAPTPPNPTPPPKRIDRPAAESPLRSLLVLIFRLLLLGVGGTIAGLIGVLAAQVYPAPRTEEPPLLEKFLQRASDLRGTLQPVPVADVPNLPAGGEVPAASSPTPALRPLNSTERQQVQTEIATLQTQLMGLGDRATALETQVGLPPSAAPIETRLQTIAQQLQPATAASPTAPVPAPAPAAAVPPPASDPDRLGVTLPIDALFTGESLRPESQILLSSVIGELQRYPNSAILVAAHADAAANPTQARARSFAQAQAIVRSLEAALGDSYHWVAVGYGQTAPIAPNDSSVNRQRNRRIEIGIFPRE